MDVSTLQIRISNQALSKKLKTPEEVVSWFGAIQSQDFAAAKWALALRSTEQTDTTIGQAFNEGKIIRTHIMRPTWHFVSPADIRWILALTSPRVHKFNGHYYRKSGLDKKIFDKSNTIIAETLQGGKQLTREELSRELEKANIPVKDLGLSFCIMQAELDALICSGPRKGKQFTYMLLDERVPKTKEISYEESLLKLITKYFQSHGPAQIQDFSWWSGLSITETKKGIAMLGSKLQKQKKGDKEYFFFELVETAKQSSNIYLVPGFDEYFIAYKDRSDILDESHKKELNQGGGMINGAVIANGKMIGGWKRIISAKQVTIAVRLFEKLIPLQYDSLEKQAQKYGEFLGLPIVLTIRKL